MTVSALCFGMLALWPLVMVASQSYISSPGLTGFGNDGTTMYVTPEGMIGNGNQIVGYEIVPADGSYNQQTALTLEPSLIDRLGDILFQQSLSPQSSADYRLHNNRNLQNFVKSQTSKVYPRADAGYRHSYAGKRLVSAFGKKSGYDKKQKVKVVKKPVYVPVPIKQQKKKKKKSKTLSVSKGFYIAGGSQMFGKFKSLKSCQKACDNTAHCFGGDYDKWTKRCYMHTNATACNSLQPHKQLTNFRKVPCLASDFGINYGRITLGANLDHGLLQKKIKDIGTCIKKCLQAGGGVAGMIGPIGSPPLPIIPEAVAEILGTPQLCFGIDYDFATHKCYFHTSVTVLNDDVEPPTVLLQGIFGGITCVAGSDDTVPRQPINLGPDSSVVNIVICPRPTPP